MTVLRLRKIDFWLSSLAALGSFIFLMGTMTMGWIMAFEGMAKLAG